jgi:folate-dependent phosphoribosylglycinamide formyltransferase PurN
LDIGWFSTGRDEAARDLLRITYNNVISGNISGKIIYCFCNREPGESTETDLFFDLVKELNIPLITYSSRNFRKLERIKDIENWRILYDREVMRKIREFKPDICMLAGYMLIVGREMCNLYDMINLHPALPDGPKGSWQEVIWQLIEKREKSSGVMLHLATPELDRGPVISYCKYSITDDRLDAYWEQVGNRSVKQIIVEEGENNDLFKIIREQGLSREFPLIILTLKSLCNREVYILNKKVFDKSGKIISGYDLSNEVDSMI